MAHKFLLSKNYKTYIFNVSSSVMDINLRIFIESFNMTGNNVTFFNVHEFCQRNILRSKNQIYMH